MPHERPVIISTFIRSQLDMIEGRNMSEPTYRLAIKNKMAMKSNKKKTATAENYPGVPEDVDMQGDLPIYYYEDDNTKDHGFVEMHVNGLIVIHDMATQEYVEFFKDNASGHGMFNLHTQHLPHVKHRAFHKRVGADEWSHTTRDTFQYTG